jgi:hypothetical protein
MNAELVGTVSIQYVKADANVIRERATIQMRSR